MSLFEEVLAECNHTELHQACIAQGYSISPFATRAELIALLLEGKELPPNENMDSWRHSIMGFLLENWKAAQLSLTCPASSGDPLSCFQCVDIMVVSCFANKNEQLISIRRKK